MLGLGLGGFGKMAASAALEQRSSRRAQLARVNTHIYTLDQFTLSLALIYACVQVYLHRSRAIYTCGDLKEAIARIILQVGQASPISGGPIWHMHGREWWGGGRRRTPSPSPCSPSPPWWSSQKKSSCSWGPGHFCVHWIAKRDKRQGMMKMGLNTLLIILRSHSKDDLPFSVRVPEKVGGKWALQEFQSEGSEGKVKIRKASYFHSVKIRKTSHHTASSVHSVRV